MSRTTQDIARECVQPLMGPFTLVPGSAQAITEVVEKIQVELQKLIDENKALQAKCEEYYQMYEDASCCY